MRRLLATLLSSLWLGASAALASQATLVTPAAPLPMTGLASFINAALLSVGSCNSGNSAPTNGTGAAAFAYECWANTTSNPTVFQYTDDGTHWAAFGSLNTSTHAWTVLGSAATISANAAAAVAVSGPAPLLQAVSADGVQSAIVIDGFGTNVQPFFVIRDARGTGASFTATQSGDNLGFFGMVGATGANTFPAINGSAGGVFFGGTASETWTAAHQGSEIRIFTTPNTTAVIARAATFQNSGGFSVGTTTDPGIGAILANTDLYSNDATYLVRTKTTLTSSAAGNTATLTNAPTAGNPTKWFAIDDNGTSRKIPAW